MPAMEPHCRLMEINPEHLNKGEYLFLEAELFLQIHSALKEYFIERFREYFTLMKFTIDMENAMLEANFVRLIIEDILATGEYTIMGVAEYTDTPEDVVHEVLAGCNKNPSALFLQKVIALHRSVRSELYRAIMRKVIAEHVVLPEAEPLL